MTRKPDMPPPRVVVDAVTVDEYGALAVQLPCAFTVEFGRTDLRFYDVEAVTAPIEFAVTADNVGLLRRRGAVHNHDDLRADRPLPAVG